MNCSIMKIPTGFKIRKKVDCDAFIEKCMCKGNTYDVVDKEKDIAMVMEKDTDGNVSVCMKFGDLHNIFNPLLTVACTNNSAYKESVQDYVWKYRKLINDKWFNEKNDY